jgi:hypothetical protein
MPGSAGVIARKFCGFARGTACRARTYAEKIVTVVFLLSLAVSAQVGFAAGTEIRKFCAPHSSSFHPLQLFLASNIGSQQLALQRNSTLQEGKILFSRREGDALFHMTRMEPGDCVLLNLQEAMRLAPVDVSSVSEFFGGRNGIQRATFLPAIFFVQRDSSKHYGLIAKEALRRLRPVKKASETATEAIVNAETDPDLVLVYITCPPDRNSPCDLTVKRNGTWLLDEKTGKQFHLPVLARSVRNGRPSSRTRRIWINHDTPQGIYTIWGTMIGGGVSSWFRTARIDLDAALPPINGQPYPVNSFLLSRIIPEAALDDYWVNEWPLAYSLGRIALRIAPGDFEAQQTPSLQPGIGNTMFHPTHGCINTGDQQEQLLRVLIEAGVFRQEDVVNPSGNSEKRWSVSLKLGRAFVILKDRDKADE